MSEAWPTVLMGEVAPLVRRPVLPVAHDSYREIGIRSFGKGIFHKTPTTSLDIGSKRVFAVEPGDLLFNIVFAWEGAIAVAAETERGMIGSHRFLTCVPDNKRADAQFLKYWFTHSVGREQLLSASPGGAGRNRTLGVEKLAAIPVPLPHISEQRRIVARIETLTNKLGEAKNLGAESALASVALSASVLDMLLPKSAPEKLLRDLIMPGTSISYGVLLPGPDTPQGVPFVRVQDLSIKFPSNVPNKRISLDVAAQYKRTRLYGGEVLIAVVGSIGKIGIAPQSWQGANIARAVCRIMPAPNINARFLAEVLSDRRCQDYFREQTRTLAQPTLNVGQLEMTPIKFPSIEEQHRIVAELDVLQAKVEEVKMLQAETAIELDAILPAILDKAFKGEL